MTNNKSVSPSSLDCLLQSEFYSLKGSNYFQIYDELFRDYRGKEITFVEVGVFNGGSLFIWRKFFGEKARIIGIDLNPEAKQWEKYGFEIFIGDQQSRSFWSDFYAKVNSIDILLDDGGHTYAQQIVTTEETIKAMTKGIILIEDTVTSFARPFGYPSKFTFTNWSLSIINGLNARFLEAENPPNRFTQKVDSCAFYTSMIAIHINEERCTPASTIVNNGAKLMPKDYRHFNNNLGSSKRFRQQLRDFLKIPKILLRSTAVKLLTSTLDNHIQRREARRAARMYRD